MSTSCVIALYSKDEDEIILLEKTHDGFLDNIKELINEARNHHYEDIEEITGYLLKSTDVRYSIYSHKYPQEAFIYYADNDEWQAVEIDPKISKIKECLDDIKNAIQLNENSTR